MTCTLLQAKNPQWADAEHTMINLDTIFEHTQQEGWLPFTANPNDCEPHGRMIFKCASEGMFGEIAEYVTPPLPPAEELAKDIREQRDALLAKTDWIHAPDVHLSAEKKQAWLDYRQALRDIPKQQGFPYDVVWPIKPR